MAGAQQHFIPASLIGRFAEDVGGQARLRKVWVRDKRSRTHKPYKNAAGKVALEPAMYGVGDASEGIEKSIDHIWSIYEPLLPDALNAISSGSDSMDGLLWAQGLVPFVAGLFVRGPDFALLVREQVPGGFADLVDGTFRNNAAPARATAFQDLLALIVVANWTVLHFRQPDLITSDTGYMLIEEQERRGYAIPIDRSTALLISNGPMGRRVLYRDGGGWRAPIKHIEAAAEIAAVLVAGMASQARNAVFGPTESSVNFRPDEIGSAQPSLNVGLVPQGGIDSICHTYDYFRLLSVLTSSTAQSDGPVSVIDWNAVLGVWSAPILVEVRAPERTSGGVYIEGHDLFADLVMGSEVRRTRLALNQPWMEMPILIEHDFLNAVKRFFQNPEMTVPTWRDEEVPPDDLAPGPIEGTFVDGDGAIWAEICPPE